LISFMSYPDNCTIGNVLMDSMTFDSMEIFQRGILF